jgi:hypothetical protein
VPATAHLQHGMCGKDVSSSLASSSPPTRQVVCAPANKRANAPASKPRSVSAALCGLPPPVANCLPELSAPWPLVACVYDAGHHPHCVLQRDAHPDLKLRGLCTATAPAAKQLLTNNVPPKPPCCFHDRANDASCKEAQSSAQARGRSWRAAVLAARQIRAAPHAWRTADHRQRSTWQATPQNSRQAQPAAWQGNTKAAPALAPERARASCESADSVRAHRPLPMRNINAPPHAPVLRHFYPGAKGEVVHNVNQTARGRAREAMDGQLLSRAAAAPDPTAIKHRHPPFKPL